MAKQTYGDAELVRDLRSAVDAMNGGLLSYEMFYEIVINFLDRIKE